MKEYVVFQIRNGKLYKETPESYKRPLPRIEKEEMEEANITFNPDVMLCGTLRVNETEYLSGGTVVGDGEVLEWSCVMFKSFGKSHIVWMAYEDMSDADTFMCYHLAKGDAEEAMFLAKHDLASEEELAEYGRHFKKLINT